MVWYDKIELQGNNEEQTRLKELLSKISQNPFPNIPSSKLEARLRQNFVPRREEVYLCPTENNLSLHERELVIPLGVELKSIGTYDKGISFEFQGVIYYLNIRFGGNKNAMAKKR